MSVQDVLVSDHLDLISATLDGSSRIGDGEIDDDGFDSIHRRGDFTAYLIACNAGNWCLCAGVTGMPDRP